jgi:hypothetical protein
MKPVFSFNNTFLRAGPETAGLSWRFKRRHAPDGFESVKGDDGAIQAQICINTAMEAAPKSPVSA